MSNTNPNSDLSNVSSSAPSLGETGINPSTGSAGGESGSNEELQSDAGSTPDA